MFVLISRLKAAHYNAQQSKDIIMPVPIHAAVMLGHALGERLGKSVQGVALVLHDARVEEEWLPKTTGHGERLLSNKRGATAFYVDKPDGGGYANPSKKPAAMSYQMHATANGCFSLVLDLGNACTTQEDVQAQLRTMRFAGGTLQNMPRVMTMQTVPELLQHLSSGYLVMDASARAAQALAAGQEPAHVFLHKHSGGYVVPAVVGYHLLTALSEQRKGMRHAPDMDVEGHAFAESVVGLIEFFHINRFKFPPPFTEPDAADDGFTDSELPLPPIASIFWQHGWSQDGASFLIQQH